MGRTEDTWLIVNDVSLESRKFAGIRNLTHRFMLRSLKQFIPRSIQAGKVVCVLWPTQNFHPRPFSKSYAIKRLQTKLVFIWDVCTAKWIWRGMPSLKCAKNFLCALWLMIRSYHVGKSCRAETFLHKPGSARQPFNSLEKKRQIFVKAGEQTSSSLFIYQSEFKRRRLNHFTTTICSFGHWS